MLHEPSSSRWFTLCRRPRPTKISGSNPNPNPNLRLFTSCFRPYRFLTNCTRKKDKSRDNALVSITIRNSPIDDSYGLIAVGCNFYRVGSYINGSPSSSVLIMDSRSHTWKKAPSMRVARENPRVSVLDGKIYVAGGNKNCDSSNCMEFFDPKTQTWEHLPSPDVEMGESLIHQDLAIEGKLYLSGIKSTRERFVVYKSKENRWDEVGVKEIPLDWSSRASCVVDNVLYTFRWPGVFEWYDFEERSWRFLVVKGLGKLSRSLRDSLSVRLVDSGGKIAVLWDNEMGKEKKICCAEIVLERRDGQRYVGRLSGVMLCLQSLDHVFSFSFLLLRFRFSTTYTIFLQ